MPVDLGNESTPVEAVRVTMALMRLLEESQSLNATLLEHEKLHGFPKADSPENVLLLVTSKQVPLLIEAVAVIGTMLAEHLGKTPKA